MIKKNGSSYYFTVESDHIFFNILNQKYDEEEYVWTLDCFIYLFQSSNDNLDGTYGLYTLRLDTEDYETYIYPLTDGFDWLSSNNFISGTPQQQLIISCFKSIY